MDQHVTYLRAITAFGFCCALALAALSASAQSITSSRCVVEVRDSRVVAFTNRLTGERLVVPGPGDPLPAGLRRLAEPEMAFAAADRKTAHTEAGTVENLAAWQDTSGAARALLRTRVTVGQGGRSSAESEHRRIRTQMSPHVRLILDPYQIRIEITHDCRAIRRFERAKAEGKRGRCNPGAGQRHCRWVATIDSRGDPLPSSVQAAHQQLLPVRIAQAYPAEARGEVEADRPVSLRIRGQCVGAAGNPAGNR